MRVGGEVVGRVTTGGYGYTVERSIAYAYLPPEHAEPGTAVEVEIFGRWVEGEVAARAALRPEGRADPRLSSVERRRLEPQRRRQQAGEDVLGALDVLAHLPHRPRRRRPCAAP